MRPLSDKPVSDMPISFCPFKTPPIDLLTGHARAKMQRWAIKTSAVCA